MVLLSYDALAEGCTCRRGDTYLGSEEVLLEDMMFVKDMSMRVKMRVLVQAQRFVVFSIIDNLVAHHREGM